MLLLRPVPGLRPGGLQLDSAGDVQVMMMMVMVMMIMIMISRRRQLTISRGDSSLSVENDLIIIPGESHDVVIGVSSLFDVPIYW